VLNAELKRTFWKVGELLRCLSPEERREAIEIMSVKLLSERKLPKGAVYEVLQDQRIRDAEAIRSWQDVAEFQDQVLA